jgi:hypothetical protein
VQYRFLLLPPTARIALVFAAVLALASYGWAQDDPLGTVKDVIIDEPADKIEDVFDPDDPDHTDQYKLEDEDILRQKPDSDQTNICREGVPAAGTPIEVDIDDLRDNQDQYYGQTVTVEGEMHRTFNDRVFTIEDDGFFRDKDVLVISTTSGWQEHVVPVDDSIERGEDVRVTGVVMPYDRGKLECAYGPLNLESREGHSFTHGPVIVMDTRQMAAAAPAELYESTPSAEPAPLPEPPPPALMPEPAPPLQAPAPAVEEEPLAEEAPDELPRTAGGVPILSLVGLLSLSAAAAVRRYGTRQR